MGRQQIVSARRDTPIYVTKPDLPDLDHFTDRLKDIWNSGILTNNGPIHAQFEEALCDYLGVKEVALFANGTLSLICALQAANLSGEVITTPFSFVATTHAIRWLGLSPVFVDIDPETLNIDPEKIEAAITPRTSAILPVHCYGNPCATQAIHNIAVRHDLKVIYDGAHAFGVNDDGGSILRHGDFSALSFHATKVFNTFEGGAVICHSSDAKQHINNLKNFGIINEELVEIVGINGKMSELNALCGLLLLERFEDLLIARERVASIYDSLLAKVEGINSVQPSNQKRKNHSYYPILVESNYPLSRDELYTALRRQNIFTRKYFSPLLSNMPMYKNIPSSKAENLPVASKVDQQILCLPIYPALSESDVEWIAQAIAAPREHGLI